MNQMMSEIIYKKMICSMKFPIYLMKSETAGPQIDALNLVAPTMINREPVRTENLHQI